MLKCRLFGSTGYCAACNKVFKSQNESKLWTWQSWRLNGHHCQDCCCYPTKKEHRWSQRSRWWWEREQMFITSSALPVSSAATGNLQQRRCSCSLRGILRSSLRGIHSTPSVQHFAQKPISAFCFPKVFQYIYRDTCYCTVFKHCKAVWTVCKQCKQCKLSSV